MPDNGPGVAPDQLVRIFDRYYSSRPSKDTDDVEETGEASEANGEFHFGIGLWLVQQHAQAMGGTVEAANRDGGGLRMDRFASPWPVRTARTTA